jgi:hypothetical protein
LHTSHRDTTAVISLLPRPRPSLRRSISPSALVSETNACATASSKVFVAPSPPPKHPPKGHRQTLHTPLHSTPHHPTPRISTRHCCPCRPAAQEKPLLPTHACRRASTSLSLCLTLCLLLHSCLRDANIRSSRLNDPIAPKAPPPAPLRPLHPAGQCRKHKTTLPKPIHGHHQVTCNPTIPPAADPPARGGASRATLPWPNQQRPVNPPELPRLMLVATLATTQSNHSLHRPLLMVPPHQR